MDFRKQKPIYLQIADNLSEQVLQGQLMPDGRMPSVRDVATAMGVNPNTVVRTFDYLQQEDIIYQRRGVGYFVATDARERILAHQKHEFLEEELPQLRQKIQLLGITYEQLTQSLLSNAQQP